MLRRDSIQLHGVRLVFGLLALAAAGFFVAAVASDGGVKKLQFIPSALGVAVLDGKTVATRNRFTDATPIDSIWGGARTNKIKRKHWVNADKADDPKRQFIRIYSDPPGAIFRKLSTFEDYFTWRALAPSQWQPGAISKIKRNARVPELAPVIGPGADIKDAEQVIKQAAALANSIAGVAAGGATANPVAMATGIAALVEQAAGIITGQIGKATKKKTVADAILSGTKATFKARIGMFNPHIVRSDGSLDFSKRYKKNPRTWGELFEAGNARPTVYVPADTDKV